MIVLEDAAASRYRKLVIADGKIVGGILVGHSAEAQGLVEAVKDGRDADGLADRLRAGDWSVFAAAAQAA